MQAITNNDKQEFQCVIIQELGLYQKGHFCAQV